MARGRTRKWSDGLGGAPWWAIAVMVVGVVAFLVMLPIALNRGPSEPLSAAELTRMEAAEAAAISSGVAEQPKPVLFLGDSYSAGTGASGPQSRFTTLVSAAENWTEQNAAYGGTGYVSSPTGDEAQSACGQDACPNYGGALAALPASPAPAVVVVSGGRNDLPVAQDDGYGDAVAAFYLAVRAQFPDAVIVATSPVWDDDPAPEELRPVADAVQAAVQAVSGSYLPIGEPLENQPALMSADSVHPNDQGHAALASAVEAALETAGLA